VPDRFDPSNHSAPWCVDPSEGGELDEATVRAFLDEEYPRVVAVVSLASASMASAEDAVCEALARAWERSARGERIDSLGAWVTTVAMNLARSRWRSLLAERRARSRLQVRPDEPDHDAAIDLRRAIGGLPARQRQVLLLHYYVGHDVARVARLLGISVGTAKSSLHRARRKLSRELEEREGHVVRPR
jgi:RNA polymerase sigma factor (sigma-70 family)